MSENHSFWRLFSPAILKSTSHLRMSDMYCSVTDRKFLTRRVMSKSAKKYQKTPKRSQCSVSVGYILLKLSFFWQFWWHCNCWRRKTFFAVGIVVKKPWSWNFVGNLWLQRNVKKGSGPSCFWWSFFSSKIDFGKRFSWSKYGRLQPPLYAK